MKRYRRKFRHDATLVFCASRLFVPNRCRSSQTPTYVPASTNRTRPDPRRPLVEGHQSTRRGGADLLLGRMRIPLVTPLVSSPPNSGDPEGAARVSTLPKETSPHSYFRRSLSPLPPSSSTTAQSSVMRGGWRSPVPQGPQSTPPVRLRTSGEWGLKVRRCLRGSGTVRRSGEREAWDHVCLTSEV